MFKAVQQVHAIMQKFPRPWFVCGGWALDLFIGRETRAHHDIEIGLLRADQGDLVRYLEGWSFEKVLKGKSSKVEPWLPGERIEAPNHEAYAKKDGFVLELLLNEHSGPDWLFRRNPNVRAPLTALRGSYEGIPYLNPEFVLLYKARDPRDKDEADFRMALPSLPPTSKLWLRDALKISEGAQHPWIPLLSARSH